MEFDALRLFELGEQGLSASQFAGLAERFGFEEHADSALVAELRSIEQRGG